MRHSSKVALETGESRLLQTESRLPRVHAQVEGMISPRLRKQEEAKDFK